VAAEVRGESLRRFLIPSACLRMSRFVLEVDVGLEVAVAVLASAFELEDVVLDSPGVEYVEKSNEVGVVGRRRVGDAGRDGVVEGGGRSTRLA